ncbi:hypothetical protein B0H11DRAFT_2030206 [Mycena galericulata]|nr:hypothetical protein B0H11DRAFT_2030206 [Mycena galericulata]
MRPQRACRLHHPAPAGDRAGAWVRREGNREGGVGCVLGVGFGFIWGRRGGRGGGCRRRLGGGGGGRRRRLPRVLDPSPSLNPPTAPHDPRPPTLQHALRRQRVIEVREFHARCPRSVPLKHPLHPLEPAPNIAPQDLHQARGEPREEETARGASREGLGEVRGERGAVALGL